MDQETIKQLIDAFSTMGGEAKTMMIWYFVTAHLAGLMWSIAGPVLVIYMLRGVFRLIRRNIDAIAVAKTGIRDIGLAIGRCYWYDETITRHKVIDCLRKHYEQD